MDRIGIIGAMPEEIALLLPKVTCKKEFLIGRRSFISGKLENREVVVVFSRMGKVAASSTATTLINHFKCGLILFTGVAGALNKSLNVGDMVIGSGLVQHDMDISILPGYKRFEIPLLDKQFFSPPSWLLSKAEEAAKKYLKTIMPLEVEEKTLSGFNITSPKTITGLIGSGDQFIASTKTSNDLLANLPDLLCVEMEGAAVAQVAYEYDIPFLVARTISDKADHSAQIDFPRFINDVASHFTSGVIFEIIKIL